MNLGDVISADGHIDVNWMPADAFVGAVPADFKDRMPHMMESEEGPRWAVKGKPILGRNGLVGRKPGKGPNYDRMDAAGLYSDAADGKLRPTTPSLRLQDQERDGLKAEVLYGVLGLDRFLGDDVPALELAYRVFCDWVADFCAAAPGRFAAIAPITSHDPEQSAREVRYAAKLGIRGIEIRPGGAIKPFWHRMWEPLWTAAEETGLPLHFHSDIGRLNMMGTAEDKQEYQAVLAALTASIGKMGNAEHLGAMILSGVLERHPKLVLVMGECDLSWIPHFLWRMDYSVTEREHSTGLKLKPSEYWQRQCKATFQSDRLGMEMIGHLGVDNVMWGNDYPHPDGVWPISHEVIKEQTAHLPEADRRKVIHDTAAALYQL